MKYELREIIDDDHLFLLELHNDPLVLKNITNPKPITLESHLKWWDSIKRSKSQERLIFLIDGEKAGLTKFYDIDFLNLNCVLGADIHENFRGKGHAKHMWNLMLEKCFLELSLHRVSLTTAEYNEIGKSLYTKLGFKIEGKLEKSLFRDNQFFDQICMRLLKEEFLENRK